MRGQKNWWRALLGLTFALAMVAPASASATTGSIEGLSIAPDLTAASVSSLDLSYDECTAEVSDCTWTATAMLAPPQWGYCPPAWSLLLEAEGNPPGLPDPPPGSYRQRQIWSMSFSGNGVRQSGPLTFGLEGVDDFRLCLYATHFSAPPVYPSIEPPNLIAERLLHVDLPAVGAQLPATPAVPIACKKHQVRKRGKCVKRGKHRHHRWHH